MKVSNFGLFDTEKIKSVVDCSYVINTISVPKDQLIHKSILNDIQTEGPIIQHYIISHFILSL